LGLTLGIDVSEGASCGRRTAKDRQVLYCQQGDWLRFLAVDILVPDILVPDILVPDILVPDILVPDILVPDIFDPWHFGY
jgi:hypothetical protein